MHIETHHPIMTEITLINGDLFPLAVVHRRAKGGQKRSYWFCYQPISGCDVIVQAAGGVVMGEGYIVIVASVL